MNTSILLELRMSVSAMLKGSLCYRLALIRNKVSFKLPQLLGPNNWREKRINSRLLGKGLRALVFIVISLTPFPSMSSVREITSPLRTTPQKKVVLDLSKAYSLMFEKTSLTRGS